MKKLKIILVYMILMLYTINGALAQPEPCGKSGILRDIDSGRILYGYNINERLPMASTTKIMTAIVAIENCDLQDKVVVTHEASGVEGSSIWLSVGEKHTMENLLFGLMLRSGNDAATAIAIHVGGSIEGFVELMNQKAKDIGALNTHFTNPHGLHNDDHYTTASDLSLISVYAMNNTDFERIVSTKYKTIPWEGHSWDRVMKNKNRLLWQYEGATGVKTGYTKKAGRCLVSSAQREDMRLLAVVLDCGPMFEECSNILDYGFSNYKNYNIISRNQKISEVQVKDGKFDKVDLITKEHFSIALNPDEEELIEVKLDIPEIVYAPVVKNDVLGTLQIYLDHELIKEIELVSKESIEENNFLKNLWDIINKWR